MKSALRFLEHCDMIENVVKDLKCNQNRSLIRLNLGNSSWQDQVRPQKERGKETKKKKKKKNRKMDRDRLIHI